MFVLVNILFWPALLLGVLPLLIHLFARSKPPRYQFSSIEFIRRIVRNTMRIKKPKDWLLLVVRTLLCIFVILMFLRPLFFSQKRLATHSRRKNVVLIIDATASMACMEGAQTRFAAACAEAAEVLAGLSVNDSANIVWLDSDPDSVFPEMGPNISYLRNALRQARVGNESGAIEEAVRIAAEMIVAAEGRREICIISDFQETAWKGNAAVVPKGVDLIRIKIGGDTVANGAVADIVCSPSAPLVGEQVAIYCEVRNHSPRPRRRTVFLRVGESRDSQSLLIPAWGQSTASFEYTFKKAGRFAVEVELDEDGFAGDDRRMEILTVEEGLDAGVLGKSGPATEIWMRVLDAIDWIQARRIGAEELQAGAETIDMLVLSDWDGDDAVPIAELLERKGIVFCSPAAGMAADRLTALIPDLEAEGLDNFELVKGAVPGEVHIVADRDEAFKLFADGEYGKPVAARFESWLKLPRALAEVGDLLAAYKDGTPALLRFKGQGVLLLWNLPLDPEQSDWYSQTGFLPFIAELTRACRRNLEARVRLSLAPGERALWSLNRDVPVSEIELMGPDDESIPIESRPRRTGVDFLSGVLSKTGLYTWKHNSRPVEFDVVNFPTVESDLRSMAMEDLRDDGAVAVARGEDVRKLRDGIRLWPYLLAAILILAMAEVAIIHWADKK